MRARMRATEVTTSQSSRCWLRSSTPASAREPGERLPDTLVDLWAKNKPKGGKQKVKRSKEGLPLKMAVGQNRFGTILVGR